MNKQLFIALCNLLESQVPEVRWIDADEGQLNTSNQRPPVAFPCVLIDMSYPQTEAMNATAEKIRVQFSLRIAFEGYGQTSSVAPEPVRERALERLDILEKIHRSLQWWNCDRQINPLRRQRVTTERRQDGLKVYNMTYESAFID